MNVKNSVPRTPLWTAGTGQNLRNGKKVDMGHRITKREPLNDPPPPCPAPPAPPRFDVNEYVAQQTYYDLYYRDPWDRRSF